MKYGMVAMQDKSLIKGDEMKEVRVEISGIPGISWIVKSGNDLTEVVDLLDSIGKRHQMPSAEESDDRKFTIEELDKLGYCISCGRCGKHGIQCDSDGEIMYKSRFYDIKYLLSDTRVPLDEEYGACKDCLKVLLAERKGVKDEKE